MLASFSHVIRALNTVPKPTPKGVQKASRSIPAKTHLPNHKTEPARPRAGWAGDRPAQFGSFGNGSDRDRFGHLLGGARACRRQSGWTEQSKRQSARAAG